MLGKGGLACARAPRDHIRNDSCQAALARSSGARIKASYPNRLTSSVYASSLPVRGEEIWLAFLPLKR